jgi:RNA polymerase sigma-70 factor (ECF subfamily)
MIKKDIIEEPAERTRAEEDELVARARNRDQAAFDALVQTYRGRIYGMVYNMTGNCEDAEDVVQDVFFKAWKALPRFKGNSSFFTWLYRIAMNRTINFVKKRKRRYAMSLNDIDEGVERDPAYVELSARQTPRRDFSLQELQENLNTALQTLSEKHRAVVVLHDIQGIAHDEIARMLGCSAGTVRSRLFYARRKLQNELKAYLP